MSNKSNGSTFEQTFAELLSEHGFWAHVLQDNRNGQPFDVIASRNGATYVFDCKDCQKEKFQLSRIEENQNNAMTLWAKTGNHPGIFAIQLSETIFVIAHKTLMILKDQGLKQIGIHELKRYGRTIEQWLASKDQMDKWVDSCR